MQPLKRQEVKKNQIITIRCTKKEKDMLEGKARGLKKSLSEYVLDCGIAGLERNRNKDRKRTRQLIENTIALNKIYLLINDAENEIDNAQLVEQIKRVMEGEKELWQF